MKDAEREEKTKADIAIDENECEGLILITALVTSCVRGLRLSSSKLQVLEILCELSKHTAAETILDRILPYIVSVVVFCFTQLSSNDV